MLISTGAHNCAFKLNYYLLNNCDKILRFWLTLKRKLHTEVVKIVVHLAFIFFYGINLKKQHKSDIYFNSMSTRLD